MTSASLTFADGESEFVLSITPLPSGDGSVNVVVLPDPGYTLGSPSSLLDGFALGDCYVPETPPNPVPPTTTPSSAQPRVLARTGSTNDALAWAGAASLLTGAALLAASHFVRRRLDCRS
jgi:LPXTG-motif cell wall-anchored protein